MYINSPEILQNSYKISHNEILFNHYLIKYIYNLDPILWQIGGKFSPLRQLTKIPSNASIDKIDQICSICLMWGKVEHYGEFWGMLNYMYISVYDI